MKTYKIFFFFMCALILASFSIVQWYLRYTDYSQLFFGIVLSFLLLVMAYFQWNIDVLNERSRENVKAIETMDKYYRDKLPEKKNESTTNE